MKTTVSGARTPDYRAILAERDYQVIAPLGSGFQGYVFKVWDVRHQEMLALKIVDSTNELADSEERIRQEFQVLKSSDRDVNLLEVFDLYQYERDNISYTWFTMELCKTTLYTRVDSLELRLRVNMAYEVLRTLAYLHNKRISHRDIKLGNLLLTDDDRLKIGDFGTAKIVRRPMQVTSADVPYLVGTVPYIAPELWRMLDENVLAPQDWFLGDQYAAGIACYQILSGGKLPGPLEPMRHERDTAEMREVARAAHERGVFSPLEVRERPSGRFPKVNAVLKRMLVTDPLQRYETMAECALAMVSALVFDGLMNPASPAT